jgi:hypothetical protein
MARLTYVKSNLCYNRFQASADLCEISSWHNGGLLVIDTDLEPGLIIVARMELICNGLKELNSMKDIFYEGEYGVEGSTCDTIGGVKVSR